MTRTHKLLFSLIITLGLTVFLSCMYDGYALIMWTIFLVFWATVMIIDVWTDWSSKG